MSKPSFLFDKLYVTLGGHDLVINGGEVEFATPFDNPADAPDTLAGIFATVSDRQNAINIAQLAHSEEVDGWTANVSYNPLNGARIVSEVTAPTVEPVIAVEPTPAAESFTTTATPAGTTDLGE